MRGSGKHTISIHSFPSAASFQPLPPDGLGDVDVNFIDPSGHVDLPERDLVRYGGENRVDVGPVVVGRREAELHGLFEARDPLLHQHVRRSPVESLHGPATAPGSTRSWIPISSCFGGVLRSARFVFSELPLLAAMEGLSASE